MLTEMTAIIIVYLIVLAATIYLGYRLNVVRWRKTKEWGKGELTIKLSEEAGKTLRQILPRLCNDGKYRSFTKEHDEMIERNTLKYRQMKFGCDK